MELKHYDDKKEKWQSHEISIIESGNFTAFDCTIFSHNMFDLTGYGATREEALEDFKKKFSYLMDEWRAFEKLLLGSDILTDDLEIDKFEGVIK